jgi:hypothetical protein
MAICTNCGDVWNMETETAHTCRTFKARVVAALAEIEADKTTGAV